MSDFEVAKELRESIVFESAWLYETMNMSNKKKDEMLEFIKVVWNRVFGRAGFAGHFNDLMITEEQIKKAAEYFGSGNSKLLVPEELEENNIGDVK